MLFKKYRTMRKPSEGEIVQVENKRANELLLAARRGLRIQEFMDAISGIEGYSLRDLNRQGHIRSMFAKELISAQFLIDFEEVISIFWKGVFEYVDRAKLYGEMIEIKAPGKKKEVRPTKNNPIHYLRYQGRMAARNRISFLYRRNLDQSCPDCGFKSVIKSDKACPRCPGVMSSTYRFSDIDNERDTLLEKDPYQVLEDHDTNTNIDSLLSSFAADELKEGTRAFQILKILMVPSESKEMCKTCGLCDADTFDIDACTNYNANIGRWLGVNKTMIASKIRRIRNALPRWLKKQGNEEAQSLLHIIPGKFRA